MAVFLRYKLEDGSDVLVEIGEEALVGLGTETDEVYGYDPYTPRGLEEAGNVVKGLIQGKDRIIDLKIPFEEAFKNVKSSFLVLRKQFEELRADEVEVKFGLVASCEAGNFALGKIGAEATYEVTLKWDNRAENAAKNGEKGKT